MPGRNRARGGRRSRAVLVALAVAVVTTVLASPVGAAGEQTTMAGPDYTGAYLEPSGSKPQSKLWFHDGIWWGVLFQKATLKFQIFRLDGSSGWVDTGVVVDGRVNSRSDALWDGTHLYVATHRYSVTSGAGFPARLLRYSYDGVRKRFVVDAGFPVQINNYKTETLVIDKDTTGTLWATWTQDSRVYVNRTVGGDDRAWGVPLLLPAAGATVSADDISTVAAFAGKVGVMWGNQVEGSYYFATHVDGDPAEAWQATETALAGPGMADDHVDLATDGSGRVWAVVKTGLHRLSDPLIVLLARQPDGTWSRHTVASNRFSHTRPIVLVDDEQRMVHVMATGPQLPATNGQSGGDIYEKSTSMDAPAFADGYGTPVLRVEGQPNLDNVTSTKQRLTAASGFVALATSEPLKQYWYLLRPGGGGAVPVPPKASFTAEPLTGTAPHPVRFTDTSTGSPTTWSWSFGDGETSAEPNPEHVYTSPGSYTVSLTVSNDDGTDTTTGAGQVTVASPVTRVGAAADTHVRKARSTVNYGGLTTLRVTDDGTDAYRAYMAFDVPAGQPVRSAVLRLWVTGGSASGGSVLATSSGWSESTVTWANAPAPGGSALGVVGRVSTGTWVEVDVSTAVVPGQRASFVVVSASADSAYYSSREGVHAPELVVTTD